jgi:HEAT repeat protein
VILALIEALKDADDGVRFHAAESLTHYGRKAAEPAVPVLISLLQDEDSSVGARSRMADCLGDIGCNARSAVPALIDVLKDRRHHAELRAAAVRALGQIGPSASEAEATVVGALIDETVRFPAAIALVKIAPKNAKLAVPVLMEGLRGIPSSDAIEALAAMGQDAKDAVPALIEVRKKGWHPESYDAAAAVKRIDPEAAERAEIK